jgi:small subunit ribosomal protein S20
MPIIKSAKKRVKVAAKANALNAHYKRVMRDALKAFTKSLEAGKADAILKAAKTANSAIDTAAKKEIIHKNKAARKKAQLSAQAKAAGAKNAKIAAKKTAKPVAKTTDKKPAAKKPTAKKAAPKKAAAKKKTSKQ